ncbi:hypothetical protein ACFL07_07100 [Pseudomonadota bacterium]|jgi:hypothetical protein
MKRQKKSRPVIILATAILLLACAGCARIQKQLGTPLEHHEFVADTHSVHYSEVLDTYGPPSKISALPGGSLFLYQHVSLTERQWGIIFPGTVGKFFKAVIGRSKAVSDVAVFTFDQDGYMTGKAADTFVNNPGGGFALTLIFKVKGLTDLTPYTLSQQGIMEWGLALTGLPGVGLNRGQSLDSGSSGMEVMVVEDVIGQRTLEIDRFR